MNLFQEENIIFINAKNKKEAFKKISIQAEINGYVDNYKVLLKGLLNREKESTTGFEDGFAIPHAVINEIKAPGIFLIKFDHPLKWESLDGQPIKVAISLLIPKKNASETQMDILSKVALSLMEKNFRDALKKETDKPKLFTIIANILK